MSEQNTSNRNNLCGTSSSMDQREVYEYSKGLKHDVVHSGKLRRYSHTSNEITATSSIQVGDEASLNSSKTMDKGTLNANHRARRLTVVDRWRERQMHLVVEVLEEIWRGTIKELRDLRRTKTI